MDGCTALFDPLQPSAMLQQGTRHQLTGNYCKSPKGTLTLHTAAVNHPASGVCCTHCALICKVFAYWFTWAHFSASFQAPWHGVVVKCAVVGCMQLPLTVASFSCMLP